MEDQNSDYLKTADLKFLELCDEIDYWKTKAKKWEDDYNELMEEYRQTINEHSESIKKSCGQALLFALHVQDDAEGNLVIKKEDRKTLADQYKELP